MKTWHFTENTLPLEIDKWVKKQVDSNHPAAIKNARFVGQAIADFLNNGESLFTENNSEPEKGEFDSADLGDTSTLQDLFNNSFDKL